MSDKMVQRLKRMLNQVDSSEKSDGLRRYLESSSGRQTANTVESPLNGAIAEAEIEIAQEALDVLARDGELDDQSRFALEAIVMPFHRPVIDIVDNSMTLSQLTNHWTHLGDGNVRSRIEPSFSSIGRLEIPGHPSLPYAGSGFVVGNSARNRHLLMTNRHVAEIFATGVGTSRLKFIPGQDVKVNFRHEVGRAESESLHVDKVVMIHPYWDMALLEVSGLPATRRPLRLLVDDPENLKDREVVTVGYPGFDPSGDTDYQRVQSRIFRGVYYVKRMQPGALRIRDDVKSYGRVVQAITHDCSTLGGNSGSAVIDVATGMVIGLHFAGAYLVANFAVSSFDLARDARVVDAGVNFSGRLPFSDFYGPVWRAIPELNQNGSAAGDLAQSPEVRPLTQNDSDPIGAKSVVSNAIASLNGSTINIDMPIRITLSVGNPLVTSKATPASVDASPDQPVEGSQEQRSYDPHFLAEPVHLPLLSHTHKADAVDLNGSHLIPYTHFSVCQSKSRRLPRFVSWNINGSSLKTVSRKGIEFKLDERVPKEFQAGEELYQNNDYDRGHVARRADLVWGTFVEAKKANLDSFFFTNITPQHKRFNQSALSGLWGELENAIFEDVDVHDLRISVIAGPVFKDDDPEYRGVKIPRDFWKLIAFCDASDNRFKIAAYILSQDELVFTEALELDPFKLHQVSLSELALATGLNFEHLRPFDTLGVEVEGISRCGRREIGSRGQLLAWDNLVAISNETYTRSSRRSHRTSSILDLNSLTASTFSWEAAYVMALCSQLAYEPPASVTHIAMNNWGFDSVNFIEAANIRCFVAIDSAVVVVSFRGSESVADWITNLSLFSTTRIYGSVHTGFANAFDLVKTAIRAILANSLVGSRKLLFTGHSLGGALATIAAAEFGGDFAINGIYTFGQPRVGKANFVRFATSHFGQRLYRIVNDDDIVPRVPPGYEHVGVSFHLGADGSIIEGLLEAARSSSDPTSLSEEEFLELKKRLREIRLESYVTTDITETRQTITATTEGIFPGFSDHKLDRYISKIRRLAMRASFDRETGLESTLQHPTIGHSAGKGTPALLQYRKIDSGLEFSNQLAADNVATESVRSSLGGNRGPSGSPVLLRLSESDWIAPEGIKIHSRIGKFATAHCNAAQLERLRTDPGVLSVEGSRDAGLPEVALSVPLLGAAEVHQSPIEETGECAIVGIIDTGIDIMHEAFLDGDGNTRILGIWNQRERAQAESYFHSPHATIPDAFSQDYGVLYLKKHLDQYIASGIANVPSTLRDPGPNGGAGHGTHVSSIAAGRKVGQFKGGIAPDAKLLVVIPNMVTSHADPPSLGYSNSHVDALSFLLAAAKTQSIGGGRPIAINVSLGMNAGAHDGLSTLEAAFDAATNNGRDPNVVIVKSAGNEGNSGGHAELQAFNGTQQITWQSENVFRHRDYIEVWYGWQHELEFMLVDPGNHRSPVVSSVTNAVSCRLGGNFCTLVLTEHHPDSGDHRLQVTIVPDTATIQSGVWKLEITGLCVGGGSLSIHAWVERDNARAVRFQTGDNNAMTISVPGTAEHIITVSASGSSLPLTLTESSSRGLTRDLRAKPDICAPGTEIIAAASNTTNRSAIVAMTGTSMAAPHVAGAVALALSLRRKQGKSPLNANQLRSLLKRNAIGRRGTHHPCFGFGGLDVKSFLDAVEEFK